LLAATGYLYAGLVYPIVVALITVVVGGLYIRETRHVRIWDEVGGEAAGGALREGPTEQEAAAQGGFAG
jgi:hypothetical protein